MTRGWLLRASYGPLASLSTYHKAFRFDRCTNSSITAWSTLSAGARHNVIISVMRLLSRCGWHPDGSLTWSLCVGIILGMVLEPAPAAALRFTFQFGLWTSSHLARLQPVLMGG
eukprot:CAMPEP_0181229324 /NCGR_PEP_ID=MMETSP1096-20121128/33832_1 /TAXON_ID=156174 ORGANISM="Chrysochromulina ericina, Strain CCMP281" /NCGR_SAMPLE_ID=MMETSP1096 /ASSEMBLY_ACC=CAM_ASM_000453 /LENGTH=113 /DNA_ID=CAMNT_0023322931 /DNA_START=273 /DNA_END=610 /DNA_ORIENTATION=+